MINPHTQGLSPRYLALDLTLYAGRFVALIEGRVVAVADTAEDARLRASLSHYQRQPVILRVAALEPEQKRE